MKINEEIHLKNGQMKTKSGTSTPIVYIDPSVSDNVYAYKDTLKKYGAVFIGKLNAWGWFVKDKSIYKNQIEPCLMWLNQQIGLTDDDMKAKVTSCIDGLLAQFQAGNVEEIEEPNTTCDSKEDVEARLKSYKEQLVSTLSDENFKKMLEPIMKFRRAQGHQFSITNAILILIQDGESTMVKSKSNWEKLNRQVKDGAKALWAWVPFTLNSKPLSERDKAIIINKFLKAEHVSTVEELSPGAKEEMAIQLKPKGGERHFKLKPAFFDIRDTVQMEGKEDLVGDPSAKVDWYSEGGDETDKLSKLLQATTDAIKGSGVQVNYVDDLDGARGVSKSGNIDVLSSAKKNEGLLNTMVHEFAHEILHQKYLQSTNKELGAYFVGTNEGRAKVEQQAELTAWIVLKEFGYDMPTNINYVGLWGMDEKNAFKVFDSVADVATKITQMINKNLSSTLKEAMRRLDEALTGKDVANMIGMGQIYDKSKQEAEQGLQEIRQSFNESFNRLMGAKSNWRSELKEDRYDRYFANTTDDEDAQFLQRNKAFNSEFLEVWNETATDREKRDKVAFRTAYSFYLDNAVRDGRVSEEDSEEFCLSNGYLENDTPSMYKGQEYGD